MTAHRPTGAPAPAPSTAAITADTATARTEPTVATDVAAATDGRIARGLVGGDEQCPAVAYRRWGRLVHTRVARALGDHREAEDVTSGCSSPPGGAARTSVPTGEPCRPDAPASPDARSPTR